MLHPHIVAFLGNSHFITREGFAQFMLEHYNPIITGSELEIPDYQEQTKTMCEDLSSEDINLTNRFNETDIPENSIAFHRIYGTIFAEYDPWGWYFSTKQFVDDLLAADANPKIVAHFILANSPGGEAWFLERAAEVMQSLKKPIVTLTEKRNCSACYYLTVNSNRIYAHTMWDKIGSIGTMIAFLDIIPYFEKLGARWIETYATQSKLKNKRFNDLLDGKDAEFKKKELDPLAEKFIEDVRQGREALGKLEKKHDVFAGDTYFAEDSRSIGLIDDILTLDQALQETLKLGQEYSSKQQVQSNAYTLLQS